MDILVRDLSAVSVDKIDSLSREKGVSRQKFLKQLIEDYLDNKFVIQVEEVRCTSCGATLKSPIRIHGQKKSYCQGCFGAAIGEHIIQGIASGINPNRKVEDL